MNTFSPIVLFVYNRPEHTKKTVEALSKNHLVKNSELFIFSDGPKNENDSRSVKLVRTQIQSVSGFKKIEIIQREKNFGLAQSVINGVSEVFKYFDSLIVLEDDIVTATGFLSFMNKALEFYKDDKNIFSVSGYTYPIKFPQVFSRDVFIAVRPSSWGWATWKDRWEKADWEMKDFKSFLQNKNEQQKFEEAGEDLIPMLKRQMTGRIDSWAIKWVYAHFRHKAYCLYPKKSLCTNIGMDSSGTHSSSSKKFYTELDESKTEFKLEGNLELNAEINTEIEILFKLSYVRKLINLFKSF